MLSGFGGIAFVAHGLNNVVVCLMILDADAVAMSCLVPKCCVVDLLTYLILTASTAALLFVLSVIRRVVTQSHFASPYVMCQCALPHNLRFRDILFHENGEGDDLPRRGCTPETLVGSWAALYPSEAYYTRLDLSRVCPYPKVNSDCRWRCSRLVTRRCLLSPRCSGHTKLPRIASCWNGQISLSAAVLVHRQMLETVRKPPTSP